VNQLLQLGETVDSEPPGFRCVVRSFIGGGGQGEVYLAEGPTGDVAVKWYLREAQSYPQRAALERLISTGAPTDRFLWPLELLVKRNHGFGYAMPLRGPEYKGIVDLMKRRAEPTFRALATAGFELADSFLALHSHGLCYRDISFGNVFLHPDTGQILIADNDNVEVDGQGNAAILGTPRFMAPEIVRGEVQPSIRTDLFSLSVLLFYMFMLHHPLEGEHEAAIKCLDLPAMRRLYGEAALFIFDPDDSSNAPVPGYHNNALEFWGVYPQFLRDAFTKAFTVGLRDPDARVRETEWRGTTVRLRDAIVYCPMCGRENFVDPDAQGSTIACWSCKEQVRPPLRLEIGRRVVMLNHDTELYPHHLQSNRLYDFSTPLARVARHPKDESIWGLQNMSDGSWIVTLGSGETAEVEPGRNVTLAQGMRINFGTVEGLIAA
jgi:eukaryotic-like serine/threonine-protein kinase